MSILICLNLTDLLNILFFKIKRLQFFFFSSKTQESNSSIESQKQQLIQNGIEEENIFVEIGSGAHEIKNRSVFQKLINQKLKDNDLLMVTKNERLCFL